ncbi:MAG: hypothetical protein GY696_00850, partial [Gammaproteobacteria bacterium]|nr:hypothetical protein [Gammaproteobacteria bacterium]
MFFLFAAGISYIENQQQLLIERSLMLDLVAKKWVGSYNYSADPPVLPDNSMLDRSIFQKQQKRLEKNGMLQQFNDAFAEAISRGVFTPATKEELEYTGPIYYSSLVEAYKEDSATTPVRICVNSSLELKVLSINKIMLPGPNPCHKLFYHITRWRGYQCAVVADVAKFYNSVQAMPFDQQLKRVFYTPELGGKPQVYLTRTINFGEMTTGCYAIAALKMTARVFGSRSLEEVRDMHVMDMVRGTDVQAKQEAWRKDPVPVFDGGVLQLPQASVAAKIELDSYVDDEFTGNRNRPAAEADMVEADNILGNGGFRYKSKTYTGDDKPETKVLGVQLRVPLRANHVGKKKGKKLGPDLELLEAGQLLPQKITKRVVWRLILQEYDLIGLLGPILLKSKLLLRELCV